MTKRGGWLTIRVDFRYCLGGGVVGLTGVVTGDETPLTMYLSAKIINTIAISFPLISGIIYGRLLIMIFWYKTIKKAPELYLFYCRFVFDLVISVISFIKMIIYGLSVMTSLGDFFAVNHWLTFMFVWPVSSFSSLRAILLFFIALDRTCATYVPITFFKYRKLIPTPLIIGIVLCDILIEAFVAFIICEVDLNTPTNCTSASCISGSCYQKYWLVFSEVCYALIIALTLMLCIKIFFWNRIKKQTISGDLRRANRLALIEAITLVIFDFAPPIANTFYSNYFEYVGAMNSVCQTLGFVVESYLTTLSLQQKYRVVKVTSSGKTMYRTTVADLSEFKLAF
ncbi:hypothetical protein B9Z55_017775 [Caenorhabditis nigoni]|uniref:G-protein coupled receptors family 1 profile domain-containing protein n=2 Tax=Caenorhabditis nigoni TaxID=1611254 RepID=A0A2G5TB67_9PELO|nr:hypothetical protein B9Z55_017775 [Caenorhabditis nigoni]